MKNSILSFLIAICVVISFSCRSRKVVPINNVAEVNNKVDVKNIDFSYVTTKSKIRYNDGKQEVDFVANIRMKKDSIIWISANAALGIEVMRCKITPDSVFILDKINKENQAFPIQDLKRKYNLDLSLGSLQALILGNQVITYIESQRVESKGEMITIFQTLDRFVATTEVSDSTRKVTRMQVLDNQSKSAADVRYTEFKGFEVGLVPQQMDTEILRINGSDKQTIQISMHHQKMHFTTHHVEFPFHFKHRYDR
jgi:hypothetical protein